MGLKITINTIKINSIVGISLIILKKLEDFGVGEIFLTAINKEGTKVLGLSFGNQLVGICVLQVVLDEAQINYFSVCFKV